MKIILSNTRWAKAIAVNFNSWTKALVSLCVLGVPLGLGVVIGMAVTDKRDELTVALDGLEGELSEQRRMLDSGRTEAARQRAAYSLKLAEMQARVVRLDALGQRITDIADLSQGEFDFSKLPALGGPGEVLPSLIEPGLIDQGDLDLFYRELEEQLLDRERQLGLLKTMMVDKQFRRESTVAGGPIEKGWMSSPYGMRRDPFNGRKVWHKGIDFAGRDGSSVIAVAGGIVTRSETQRGYGELIEVDHGDALVARYAHNKRNLVKVGDLVKKGQTIALMGSTGRSTGPHVHFEVHKNGRHVDPASYIRRTVR